MEILSPASNMKHIQVAINEQADAVYGGLKKWNARNKAINFNTQEYNLLIDKLHSHGIKFYLTLNILTLDLEIDDIVEFLRDNTLPDAFIVADIGLIMRLKKEFPTIPLHFSTQFGAHNIDDVNYIKFLGGSRAILARELTLNEVNNIKKNTDLELETFIWGSQCLSFSGLCFFGTIINGGGGNRGKCIITCRDVYSVNSNNSHFLYVPDMDATNLIGNLDEIDCLKLEGRRRNPQEIASILKQIKGGQYSTKNIGYLYGSSQTENKLFENINSRIKPICPAKEMSHLESSDICIKYHNNIPIKFSTDYENNNVFYVYSEITKPYLLNKKNISLDFVLEQGIVKEILYVNYKGDGHTFFSDKVDEKKFDFYTLRDEIENQNSNINVYKMKYYRDKLANYKISSFLYDKMLSYIKDDCSMPREDVVINKNFKLHHLYLETDELDVVEKVISDNFVTVIYNITSVEKLQRIKTVINQFGDKIVYKLPLFNWKSIDLLPYYKLLENKKVMFTRLSQIYLTENIKFKQRLTDYTVYVWNKEALNYLLERGIEEFTGSPELNYKQNSSIYGDNKFQMIIAGKIPLVYTRNCFYHLYNCNSCTNCNHSTKSIINRDKQLNFDILCNKDYRILINREPILNDYSKVELNDYTKFRYITTGQNINEILETIEIFKNKDYYNKLKTIHPWDVSYECNLIDTRC